ncbi:AAA family ATPase [Micromonospora sp. 4G57]|uniref:AAA family ATPase n=1 Tax=Micromonospora sicca TaxID=2202420 RepID=A0ABU5JNB0_9ACTN|nr:MULTISPECIES: AAA family ATPase [unclassified Micromonospora]MDZ5447369.1 AAA family ATPase [Micromonospora sp. 4G57]MDZ5494066.1 AAA family ATPase [Micromonospora sp. 4G53]
MPDFLGRGEDLDTALEVLQGTRATGIGAVVAVTGEAGIGKTTFITELRERAVGDGFATGRAAALESGGIAPLAPLLTALRSGPAPVLSQADFGALATYASRPIWLVDRLTGQLRARATATPILICVEDLQWADAATRYVLRVLPAQLVSSAIVWLFSSRLPLDAIADDVAVHEILLGPLPLSVPEAGGNPLLAVALTRGQVAEAVRHMLSSLPSTAKELLTAAAALGPSFTVESLGALPDHDALARLVREGLLADDGRRLHFRHELLRQALLI